MVGVEIDLVASDCLQALALWEQIFDIQRVEVTEYDRGLNEAIFTLYGTRFHLLDHNPEYGLEAPEGCIRSMWMNVLVPDIAATFDKAMAAGCTVIQPVTELPDYGVINAIFADTFGYQWMLHQMVKEVSFEERKRLAEEQMQHG